MQQAAEGLDYKYKPGVIVVVTNGEETCGAHLAAETDEDLVEALDKTLGYAMVTQRLEVVWLASWAASHHDF